MKSIIILLMLVVQVNAQISIQNASFENWTTPTMPASWGTYLPIPFPGGVNQSTIVHTGSSSLKISPYTLFTGVAAPDIVSRYAVNSVSTLPLYYAFWAQVHLVGTDRLYVTADLYKKPSQFNVAEAIGYIDASINTTVWTQFSFTLGAGNAPPADSIVLRFNITQGAQALDITSYVLIDDVAFTSGPTGVQDITKQTVIENAYPNPANTLQTMIYSVNKSSTVKLEVYDLFGNTMSTIINETQLEGKYKTEIDVRDYANGIYSIVLSMDGQTFSQKMMVYH